MSKKSMSEVKLLGYACGAAANNIDCALGPWYFFYHQELFKQISVQAEWVRIVEASTEYSGIQVMPLVKEVAEDLGKEVIDLVQDQQRFCVIGGDHSSAVGTWSGYAHAMRSEGDVGVIWIDAHMDAHTPQTSETKNIHGMPLAHLLGYGDQDLVRLFDDKPALKPENVCLIGARSYESGEAKLLASLGVKTYFMDELQKIGVQQAIREAYEHLSAKTCRVGISLDLDSIDPKDAPGVGCPAANGLKAQELIDALKAEITGKNIMAAEIVEYNPVNDINGKTVKIAMELFDAIYG